MFRCDRLMIDKDFQDECINSRTLAYCSDETITFYKLFCYGYYRTNFMPDIDIYYCSNCKQWQKCFALTLKKKGTQNEHVSAPM